MPSRLSREAIKANPPCLKRLLGIEEDRLLPYPVSSISTKVKSKVTKIAHGIKIRVSA